MMYYHLTCVGLLIIMYITMFVNLLLVVKVRPSLTKVAVFLYSVPTIIIVCKCRVANGVPVQQL